MREPMDGGIDYNDFMVSCLAALLAIAAPAAPGTRMPQLDSIAADVSDLGFIPESGRLIVLAAARGWPGRVGSISVTEEGASPSEGLFSDGDMLWGFDSLPGGGVLVTAPVPACVPEGLPIMVEPGDSASFSLSGAAADTMLVQDPAGCVAGCPRGPDGTYRLRFAGRGVYWVEALADRGSGPEVLMLVPVLCGVSIPEVLGGGYLPDSEASTLPDVLAELDSIRAVSGAGPLEADGRLEAIARERACDIALSGAVVHGEGLAGALGGDGTIYAENIGRGSGLDEAWSMILTSPAHRASCLLDGYSRVGMAAAVEIERDGWQFVLVQVFEGMAAD